MSRSLVTKVIPLACISALIGILAYAPSATQALPPSVEPLAKPATEPFAESLVQPDYSGLPRLSLADLVRRPVGPAGLEFSEHVKSLEGQKVQVTGFMVHTDWADQTTFMLSDYPSNVSEREFGGSDDLPPLQLFVKLPAGKIAGFQRGVLSLAGTLRLGPADEAYERRSFLRLELDPAVQSWHVSPKTVAGWSEQTRQQYLALASLQRRISCASCTLPPEPEPQATSSASSNSPINTRKNKP
jgi:hypothetical protein